MIIYKKISSSGKTKECHIIHEDNVNLTSYAALILLNNKLKHQDVDYLNKTVKIQYYLDKRFAYLTRKLKITDNLKCKYCGKSHLEIGHRLMEDSHLDLKNPKLATIDHRVPKSEKLIDPMDETNWCIACRRCNRQKGSKSEEQFIREIEYYKKNRKIRKLNKSKNKLL